MKKIKIVCNRYEGVLAPFTVGNIVRNKERNETTIVFDGTLRTISKSEFGYFIVAYSIKNNNKIHFMRLYTDEIKYLEQINERGGTDDRD